MARCDRKRAVVACQGLRVAAEMFERIAAIVMKSGGVAGAHRQCFVEAFQRLLVALQRVENDAVIGQHIRRSRPDFQRRGDQPQSFGRAALLVLEHAAEMERVEILGIGAQDAVVDLLRLAQPPLPMQGKCLLNETRRGGARRGCMPFHADTRSPAWRQCGTASAKVGQYG
jgi:hypothetical protein